MAFFKRWKRKKIKAEHPNWKQARWTVEFMLGGRREHQAVPEARTQAQAERAEVKLREDIYNRRYGNGRAVRLAEFFEQTYLPTLKGSAIAMQCLAENWTLTSLGISYCQTSQHVTSNASIFGEVQRDTTWFTAIRINSEPLHLPVIGGLHTRDCGRNNV